MKITKSIKAILFGFIVTVIGAILLDCEVRATGLAVLFLGVATIMFGPLAVSLDD